MASHADLVVNLLGGQLQFGAGGSGHSQGHTGDRLDAFDHGDLLARTIVGSNVADNADQSAYHKQRRRQ